MNTAVQLKILPSGVALITINLQQEKVNVLSSSLMAELTGALDTLSAETSVRGLIIASGKEDNFIAGANLDEILSIQSQPAVVSFNAAQEGKAIFARIAALPYPTVAAINGVCLGGGTELALACKFRLASDNPKTKIGLPEVGLGFIPGWGGTVRLARLIGAQSAMGLILQPLKTFDAGKAWREGVVDEAVPGEQLLPRAEAVALSGKVRRARQPLSKTLRRLALERNPLGRMLLSKLASKGIFAETRGNYPAPPAAFKVIMAALSQPAASAFYLESTTFARLAVTPESRNLVGIFFASQQAKKAPDNAAPSIDIKTVGVMGAGVMGAGIAQAAVYAGYKVVLYDKFAAGLEKGHKTITDLFDSLVEKRKLTREAADALLANLTVSADFNELAACDLVIEAVIEDMKVKQAVLCDLEKLIGHPFIFATNTSSLSVTTMMENGSHPELAAGLHFFNPVYKMPLVEVVQGAKTDPATVAALKSFAGKLGKTAVSTSDSPGFVVNRILAPYLFETIRLMEEGVPLQDIEDAMKKFGMPMGPLALLDEVGLDIATKVIHVLHDALGDRITPPNILGYIESNKLLGKKSGRGIYIWENGKRAGFNSELVAALNATPKTKSRSEIQDRLVMAMINEAVRCLEEGVVEDPSQVDLAMIMGTGFPPFRGGPLRLADQLGSRALLQKLSYLSQVAGDNYKPAALLATKAELGDGFYR